MWYVLSSFRTDSRFLMRRANDAIQTVMVLKYLIKDYPIQTLYFGIANVVANGLVMLR